MAVDAQSSPPAVPAIEEGESFTEVSKKLAVYVLLR